MIVSKFETLNMVVFFLIWINNVEIRLESNMGLLNTQQHFMKTQHLGGKEITFRINYVGSNKNEDIQMIKKLKREREREVGEQSERERERKRQ